MSIFKRRTATAVKERSEEEGTIPAGADIATRTGNVAHTKSAVYQGARCEEMREWTGWRLVRADENLKRCHRCDLATRNGVA